MYTSTSTYHHYTISAAGCGLMAMGWVDENGSWNWNETRSDINSLPREVSSNVRGVHACVNAKVAEYKASGLNWESCESTFTRGERRSINHFLRLVRKEK